MVKLLLKLMVFILPWLPLAPALAQTIPEDDRAAVILAYQRIGEDNLPDASLQREQFEAHIRELVSGDYNVMAVPDIVKALAKGEKLPPLTVGITFDGGHRSILDDAVPLLRRHKLPYTVFVASGYAETGNPEYLGWADIRQLAGDGLATIGLHSAAYTHLGAAEPAEITRQINTARAAYRENLGSEAMLFAYPFGEYDSAAIHAVRQAGFAAAFGQQSGVAYNGSDLFALPRFTMTETFGNLERFRMTATALPLPVTDVEPSEPVLLAPRPTIGFTVSGALKKHIGGLNCFVSGQDRPEMEIVGGNRVELRPAAEYLGERVRMNCTMPVTAGENYEEPRWRWFGMLFNFVAGQETTNASPDETARAALGD